MSNKDQIKTNLACTRHYTRTPVTEKNASPFSHSFAGKENRVRNRSLTRIPMLKNECEPGLALILVLNVCHRQTLFYFLSIPHPL